MKLEKQVPALKYSKRLAELGVKQESVFYWLTGRKNESVDLRNKGHIEFAGDIKDLNSVGSRKYRQLLANEKVGFGLFSAFTVAELGEKLPKEIYTVKTDKDWYCWSDEDSDDPDLQTIDPIHAKTEANARAKMLIYLRENNLLQGGEKNG